MNTPSIYDYHDNEVEAARRIRRERRREAIEAVVGVPLVIAAVWIFVIACAVA